MSTGNKNLFLKLNNYDYSENNIENIKNYLKNDFIPSDLLTNYKSNLFKKRFDKFELKDNKLYYKPLDLEVIEDNDKEKIMKDLYNDYKVGPGSSIRSFYNKIQQRYLNIKRDDVDKFIKDEPAYQITTHEKPKMINHPNLSHFPNQKWSCDLIDMSIYEGYNKHKKWILTVIDNFSRYVFAVALPNKEAKTIIKGFETIRDKQSQGILPVLLINDNGGEFKEPFSTWCEEHQIKQIYTPSHSPTSNALVENFNKYLRKIIREIFIRTNDLNWIDYLDDCTYNRNHSKQQTIKFIPADVWSPTRESIKKDTKRIKQALHIEEKMNTNEIQNEVLIK